jgi:hypothetical protein
MRLATILGLMSRLGEVGSYCGGLERTESRSIEVQLVWIAIEFILCDFF